MGGKTKHGIGHLSSIFHDHRVLHFCLGPGLAALNEAPDKKLTDGHKFGDRLLLKMWGAGVQIY